jgi:hypothetical protein
VIDVTVSPDRLPEQLAGDAQSLVDRAGPRTGDDPAEAASVTPRAARRT